MPTFRSTRKGKKCFLWWAYVCLTTTSHLHQVFFDFVRIFSFFFARVSYFKFLELRNLIKQLFHSRLLDMRLVIANEASLSLDTLNFLMLECAKKPSVSLARPFVVYTVACSYLTAVNILNFFFLHRVPWSVCGACPCDLKWQQRKSLSHAHPEGWTFSPKPQVWSWMSEINASSPGNSCVCWFKHRGERIQEASDCIDLKG